MDVAESVLRGALDTLEDVVYIYGTDGGLVYWNERLNELFGLSDAELSGMTPPEFFEADDHRAIEAAIAEVFDTGETVIEAWGQTTEGRIRFELTGRLVHDAAGAAVGFAGVGRDVTERYEQAKSLQRQNDRLGEFADILAHDLRNPLSVASGHLALLDDDAADADVASVDAIAAAHERIDRIIADVRLAACEGVVVTDPESVDIGAVAAEAWDYVDTGDATFEGPSSLPSQGDADRLVRLFENLFRNAVDHGPTDRAVSVRLEPTDGGFAVEDTGPGIDPADRERVFEAGVSDSDEGTGFGLYIVRSIASAHGWDVSVTDSESGGARFEFALS